MPIIIPHVMKQMPREDRLVDQTTLHCKWGARIKNLVYDGSNPKVHQWIKNVVHPQHSVIEVIKYGYVLS
jgi:hypothetical protein